MQKFAVGQFFDLSSFAHAVIFEASDYVWQALDRIVGYLRVYPLGNVDVKAYPGAYLVNPELISIGEGTTIEPGAYIKGPCVIGKGCSIRHGAYIRGDCIIGDNCVVGHATEVKSSIMFNHSHAAHFAYIGDTIIGSHVNLGAGVKCANLRFDGKPIVVKLGSEEIATDRRKFGAIIGDYSEIGCNAVINPGSVLGKRVDAYPCMSFGGVIPENSIVKPATKFIIQTKS
jgi:UDP-N-acetylglucosamine diphosphorylase / glucose-1-phosphate thymidylyltransferase / UDP-N-acetylgalactosamine diphosphorylase / glucosamine-1-phosphate N-acetyltransferase / galactosamine-1-phosphate N-acetyltransferase